MTFTSKLTYLSILAGFSILLFPGPAVAYLGPGAGLGMLGSLVAVVFVALFILFGLVIYPIRLLRKKRREREAAGSNHAND